MVDEGMMSVADNLCFVHEYEKGQQFARIEAEQRQTLQWSYYKIEFMVNSESTQHPLRR